MTYNPKTTCTMGKYNNEAFIEKASNIQTNLSQGTYNLVVPAPPAVIPLIDLMKIYKKESDERNHRNSLQYKLIRKQIAALLRQQCASVNGLANGDVDFMVGSGFDMNKQPVPHQVPIKGQLRSVTTLPFGEAVVKYYGIKMRDFYEVLVTGPNGFSQLSTGVNPKMKLADLPTSVRLDVRVRGVNGKGPGEWSTKMTFSLAPDTGDNNADSSED